LALFAGIQGAGRGPLAAAHFAHNLYCRKYALVQMALATQALGGR
jgi:hypothetical protein